MYEIRYIVLDSPTTKVADQEIEPIVFRELSKSKGIFATLGNKFPLGKA